MATPHSPRSTAGSQSEDLDEKDAPHLELAAEKLVCFGQGLA